ncbi:MAG: hypothetical protein Q7W16_08440 [Coriobacteriia bacterium]|nr:hypothetical protein [Coriobacteriia bacterium]
MSPAPPGEFCVVCGAAVPADQWACPACAALTVPLSVGRRPHASSSSARHGSSRSHHRDAHPGRGTAREALVRQICIGAAIAIGVVALALLAMSILN